ncbi:peptidase U32 family protein [Psychromonas sp. 14N.309.X.WAT.B.A12]|uniref:ubiquinone anaerobic biosynthesis protein UbiU n=1 Tax=unclassified Psychromonas TaxID=2614957 RepID=UPI0025B22695|nr:peptidase U32 family protein [Psychromonas sp. 14N.309.X.WAT.B.A12]MDN2663206.1 U32 family peptidase [Psychromonas sp. 14N.309.X.WAT.B.A12]
MELLCPAGSLPALKVAIDCGADAVYIGLKDETNARHFAGLNFNASKLVKGAQYVADNNKHLHVAINTFAHPGQEKRWYNAVDQCVDLGANAAIIADIATLDYATRKYPDLALHLSVQASATNTAAIEFYQRNFNIKRVVLPRVLSLHQVKQLARNSHIPLEVFAFGSLCIMAEGRCYLSSYFTGESPNTVGACSPAKFVRWQETSQGLTSRLNNILIDRYHNDEKAGYPTLCKGRFNLDGQIYHTLEEPTSLNTLSLLPDLIEMGISSVKIEGRQRSPAYVEQITRVWRAAIDSYMQSPAQYQVKPQWDQQLENLSEGNQTTLGAYHRSWQ